MLGVRNKCLTARKFYLFVLNNSQSIHIGHFKLRHTVNDTRAIQTSSSRGKGFPVKYPVCLQFYYRGNRRWRAVRNKTEDKLTLSVVSFNLVRKKEEFTKNKQLESNNKWKARKVPLLCLLWNQPINSWDDNYHWEVTSLQMTIVLHRTDF